MRFAVATAGARGGTRMIALIQARNVAFFRHLGWSALGDETDYRGATHQEMTIALAGAQPEFAPGGYAWALGAACSGRRALQPVGDRAAGHVEGAGSPLSRKRPLASASIALTSNVSWAGSTEGSTSPRVAGAVRIASSMSSIQCAVDGDHPVADRARPGVELGGRRGEEAAAGEDLAARRARGSPR